MFKPNSAFSGFSVSDIDEAKTFYGTTLGLDVNLGEMGVLDIKLPGGGSTIIYPKPNHQAATFTVLNFVVSNIEDAVKDLKERGVKFESYNMPELKTDDDDIMRGNGPTIAWFTDPAGNILSLIQED
ncbi:VOC family protein [Mucilaginibacter sp. JRF]|uniref:VOC family protein n=1 Tax=Mucilaginibacter sp. JRF TaxID=2780088 RepID=UPI00187EE8B9|nr:VOC family protein [Mucilaginibacter sp. JRF]MBE9584722.1 VOC family protein [Mucilaginibacter sp. JRF]